MIFHNILPACEEGNAEAWRAFLKDYASTGLRIFGVYTPWGAEACLNGWRDALRELTAQNFAALRGFSHQSEREFLVDLRAFLQDWATPRLDSTLDAANPPVPTAATLTALLDGLPLLHQEIAFLALAGHSQASIENLLRITPAVAKEGLERLSASYAAVMERTGDRCLWPSAWIGICRGARGDTQKDCTPLRQLVRMLDGQASWYDKSPAEAHRSKCLHCLELWTSLLEVTAWDRLRQPLPAEKIEALLAVIPVKQEKRKTSLLGRMLGK